MSNDSSPMAPVRKPQKSLPSLPQQDTSPKPSPKFSKNAPVSPRARRWEIFSATAVALHKFDGDDETRLPLSPGDMIAVLERGFGWLKGRNLDTDCVGIFPASYAQLLPPNFREDDSAPNPADATLLKGSQAMLEWGELMNAWLQEGSFAKASLIQKCIQKMMKLRSVILNPKSSTDVRKTAKREMRTCMFNCTTDLGISFTVKDASGVYADDLNSSPLETYRLYREIDTKYKPHLVYVEEPVVAVSSAEKDKKSLVQIYLKFNAFICRVDEENDSGVELSFSLYSVQKKKDITECYVVRLTNKLMVTNLEKIDLQKTIFANVDVSDTLLVCRVVRVGKISGRQKATARYRIPFGLASVPVSAVSDEHNSHFQNQLPIFLVQEKGFADMLEHFNPKALQSAGGGIAVEIKIHNNSDLASLRDEIKDFDLITITNMLEMDSSNLKPGVVRNDLYLCLERAEVQQEGKKTAKNVEVTMTIRTASGAVVPGCISSLSGEAPLDEYRTMVFYHENNPNWHEIVKVNMDVDLFAQCHVFLEARHCTTKDEKKGKLFSVGYFSLVGEGGTVIDNSSRSISLFKPNVKPKEVAYYLKPETAALKYSKEFVFVTPQLASTKLIQNPCLFKLLNWTKHEKDLPELLKQLTFVDRLELVKSIRDLFPALFAMMEGRSDLRPAIFEAISYLLSLLVAGRLDAFAPIVDEYFEHHFNNPNIYHHILSCLNLYFRRLVIQQERNVSLNALKGLQYWFKILCKSKSAEQSNAHPDALQITREIETVLMLLFGLFKSKDRADLGAQVMALKSFDELLFSSIAPFFPDDRMAKLILNFIAAVEFGHANVNAEKLEVLRVLLSSHLFSKKPVIRKACLPVIITDVQLHLSKSNDESGKCMEVLSVLFSLIQSLMREESSKGMPYASECSFFIPHVMAAVDRGGVPGSDAAELAFLTLVSILPREVFSEWITSLSRLKVKDHLHTLLRAGTRLLANSFPRNWFAMSVFVARALVKLCQMVRIALVARIQSFPKEIPVWTLFFELLFSLVLLPQLQLEHLTESKRQLLMRRYGDLRVEAAMVLRKSWNELKILQSMFVPKFVAQFLMLILSKQPDVREIGVDMYWGVLLREIRENNSFKVVGSATIDNLDHLSSQDDERHVDYAEFESFLLGSLRERMELVEETKAEIAAVVEAFLAELASLLGLLREIKTLPVGPEYEEERILATMQLMAYLRTTDRQATYIRYVAQLGEMLSESGSFVEAALTLMLYGQSLEFNSRILEAAGAYPEEAESARKERILLKAIDWFSSAKQWERAVPLIRELKHRYETVTYEYDKLAQLLQRESLLFSQIANTQRFFSNYFRVGFYGKGFNSTVRSKQFIYKGLELESLTDFTARLQLVYRKAEILKTTTISPEVENGDGQFLLVTAVNLSFEEERSGKKRVFDPAAPAFVLRYLENNDVDHFTYSKPFKGECVAAGEVLDPQVKEFASLWVRKHFMVTGETFPSYRKRLLVVETHQVDVSPIQNAVADIESKHASLIALTSAVERDASQLSPLSMLLNGIIDAAVNGGTKIYTQLFLAPQYVENRPQDAELVSCLRSLLVDQVEKVSQGLAVHRGACPDSLLGLQSKMEEFFVALEQQMVPFGYVMPVKVGSPGTVDEVEFKEADKESSRSGPIPKSSRINLGSRSGTVAVTSASVQQRSSTVSARPTVIQKQKSANDLGTAKPPELAKKKSFGSVVRRDAK